MIKNEKGITLVELLGSLAILSIIVILIGSAHLFGQRQYVRQSDEIDLQQEVRFVISQVTNDLRSVREDEIYVEEQSLILGSEQYSLDESTQQLQVNGRVVARRIAVFDFEIGENSISVFVESMPNQQGKQASLDTSIYFRR